MNTEGPSEADRFNGVRRAYTLAFLLVIKAVDELGSIKGLQMLDEAVEKQAEIVEKEIRKRIPRGLSPIELGIEVYRMFMNEAGAQAQIHEREEDYATFLVRKCPFYEALLDVNVDCGYLQGGLCANLAIPAIQSILKRFDPRLRVEPKLMKRSSEEFCLEKICLSYA